MGKILINERQLEILTEHVLLMEQQSVGDVVVVDGKKFKITDLIDQHLKKTNVGQKFASGTYQLSDESKTGVDNLLKKMITFFKTPELQNTTFNIKLEGGASQVPLGDTLANKLGINLSLDTFVGRNKELAKRRAEAIRKVLVAGLKSAGIENVIVPEPTVIVGTTKWDKNKGANHADYSKEQFMNVSVEASGTKVVKQALPDFCKKPFVPKQGGQATKGNGWKVYDGEGWEVDMGEGEGQITLQFDALQLPDMFEIIYNGETYRSKNPDTGKEGFVSGKFSKLSEKQVEALKVRRDDQKKEILKIEADIEKYGYDRPVNMKKSTFINNIKYWFDLSDRVVKNYNWEEKGESETYRLAANGEADLQWFTDFYKKFPNEKDFLKFKGDDTIPGYTTTGKGGRKATELKRKEVKALWVFIGKKYIQVQKRPKRVKKEMERLKEGILADNVSITYNEKYGGNYTDFIKAMDEKIKSKGFTEGIVGPNGEITFNKVSTENTMKLQVYAPIGDTVWYAKVGCKAAAATV